jgi:hypothetical protein
MKKIIILIAGVAIGAFLYQWLVQSKGQASPAEPSDATS